MKNYTSEVPPAKSIAKIEELLIKAGARQINKEYTANGEVAAVTFSIVNPESNQPVYVRLPADPEAVFQVFKSQRRAALSRSQSESLREQAKRTAWRLLWDWVAVQLSIIEMKQAELLQVFLPYIITGNGTFYQQLKQSQVAMLGYTPKTEDEGSEDSEQ